MEDLANLACGFVHIDLVVTSDEVGNAHGAQVGFEGIAHGIGDELYDVCLDIEVVNGAAVSFQGTFPVNGEIMHGGIGIRDVISRWHGFGGLGKFDIEDITQECSTGSGAANPAPVLEIVAVSAQHQIKVGLLRAHADISGVGNAINLAVEQSVHVSDNLWAWHYSFLLIAGCDATQCSNALEMRPLGGRGASTSECIVLCAHS